LPEPFRQSVVQFCKKDRVTIADKIPMKL